MIADFSAYQGNVNWDKTAPLLDFAILRASVGTNKDARYDEYACDLTKRGKSFHAYHYLKATNTTAAVKEADVFYNATKLFKPLFYIIDAEYSLIKASSAKSIVEQFEAELRRLAGPSIKVAIYIAHNYYKSWKLDYDKYAYVWIPRYGKNTGQPDKKPDFKCDLWQYTSKGKLDGVNGNLDLNKINGDKPLNFFIGKDVSEPQMPTAEPEYKVEIVNGNCYVRTKPSTITGKKLGVVKKGTKWKYLNQTSSNGWNYISYDGKAGWVSGKYSKVCL